MNDKIIFLIMLQFITITGIFMINYYYQTTVIFRCFLFIVLFFITDILLFKRIHYHTQLKRMNVELERAINGNLNTRLLANHDKFFNELTFSINDLIEQLEKVQIQSIKSQTVRKRILSSISHDIRTPLTSIIGYIHTLQDDMTTSDEEKRKYLEIVSGKTTGIKQL